MTIFPALLRPVSIPNNPQIEWLLELGMWSHYPQIWFHAHWTFVETVVALGFG
jgi:hypothetical protein